MGSLIRKSVLLKRLTKKSTYQDHQASRVLAPVSISQATGQLASLAYPVCPQFHGIWITVGVLAKICVCHSATESIPILDDHEVVDRRVMQSLLYHGENCTASKSRDAYCRRNTSHATSTGSRSAMNPLSLCVFSTNRIATVVLVQDALSSRDLDTAAVHVCTASAATSDLLTNISRPKRRLKIKKSQCALLSL